MSLQEEIDKSRAIIRSQDMGMSIGEWISMYKEKEIDLHPEYQRYYRWDCGKKTKFIESILLGFPIPPIFVFQRKDGIWDVVDGLQRLSTIMEFVGILLDENGNIKNPLKLNSTKMLPSFEGIQYENENKPALAFTSEQRLLFKRAKLNVHVLLRESNENAKYDLFERLNTGGLNLTPQEVRNSIMTKLDSQFSSWIKKLSEDKNFLECISITAKQKEEQYHIELALRFVIFRSMSINEIKEINSDVNEYLTDRMIYIIEKKLVNQQEEEKAFMATFTAISESMSKQAFKIYNHNKKKFGGALVISAFEFFALGIGYNHSKIKKSKIKEKIIYAWENSIYNSKKWSGITARQRTPSLIEEGRKYFSSWS